MNVGLGVDGSASNDAGSLLHEARLACFLQRAKGDVAGALSCATCCMSFCRYGVARQRLGDGQTKCRAASQKCAVYTQLHVICCI